MLSDSPSAAERAPRERLPFDQRYVVAAGAAVFFASAVGAAAYSFRRRPWEAAQVVSDQVSGSGGPAGSAPLAPLAGRTATTSRASVPVRATPHALSPAIATQSRDAADASESPIFHAASQGPLTLFREMNAAIFSAFRTHRTPRVRAQPQQVHVAPAPSGLAPRAAGIGALHRSRSSSASAPSALQKFHPQAPAPAPSGAPGGTDGPLLAFGAFSLATALVAAGSLVVVFTVRQVLNISTVEEFADKMHEILPSMDRSAVLARFLPPVPVPPVDETAPSSPPLPLPHKELYQKLDSTEDPLEWLQIARMQLDAEHAEHRERREQRRAVRMEQR